jgi:hypothetical protein
MHLNHSTQAHEAGAQPPFGSLLNSERSESRPRGKAKLDNLSAEQRAMRRARQNREAKQRQRARQASLGDRTITIVLSSSELDLLSALRSRQRGPIEGFERRALMLGATFAANAGNPRGAKVKGNSQAAAIRGTIADKSAMTQREVA